MKNLKNTMMILGLFFAAGLFNQTMAQEKSPEKKRVVKVIKIEDDNGQVTEKVFEGDAGDIDISQFIDLDELKGEMNDEPGLIMKDKEVTIENGNTIEKTTTYTKLEDGKVLKKVVKSENGNVVSTDQQTLSDFKPSDLGEKQMVIQGDGPEGGKKVIRIRKGDLDDSKMEWIDEENGNVDLDGLMKEMKINIDVDAEDMGDGENVTIRKKMVFIKIDEITSEDIQILNKAGEDDLNMENASSLELDQMKLFPNPSNGQFKIDLKLQDSKSPATVRIIDMQGKEVFSDTFKNDTGVFSKSIDISGNPQGVYFLSVTQNDKHMVRKIVTQ